MSAERVCAKSGLLVDGEARLLTDPCEYFHPGVGVQVGCGRLRCDSCKAWVRGGPPGLGLQEDARVDVRALHETQDWSTLPFVDEPYVFSNRVRLYACKCRYWVASSVEPIENDHDLDSDPNVPWACAGHPVPALPLTLNELRIDGGTSAAKLVAKILSGSCPRDLERKDALGPEPGLWLAWLYVYLRGLPIADELSSAIADRLGDPDPHVVGRVLYFFSEFPRARGSEKLVARAEADVHGIARGYPIPEVLAAPTLFGALAARYGQAQQSDAVDERIEALAKRLLTMPLASVPHDDVGPTSTVDFERQRRSKLGWADETLQFFMDDFARLRASERVDVIGGALARSSSLFAKPELRQYIADHVIDIDAAAPGRWRHVMTLLSDWLHKPEQGHLIVVAGARVIQARLATPDEVRAWIQSRRATGWVDAAWVAPLESMLAAS